MFRMICSIRQAQQVTGGISDSVFPKVDAWLQDDGDHQRALEHIASRKSCMDDYRSQVDFIFAELHPSWRGKTFAFYEGRGKQLRFLITDKERLYYEARMLALLEVGYAAYCQDRALSWTGAIKLLEAMAA